MKSAVLILASAAVVLASENAKRQSNFEFDKYMNQFQEQIKPIVSNFPQIWNSGNGFLPEVPAFPGSLGPISNPGHLSPAKRQASSKTFHQWLQLGQGNNPIGGNLPFKPPPSFGQFPFPGTTESVINQH